MPEQYVIFNKVKVGNERVKSLDGPKVKNVIIHSNFIQHKEVKK